MMTSSADEQQCKDFGFNLIIYYDREKMQKIVIDKLENDTDSYYNRIWREPSLLSCLELRTLAIKFSDTLNINDNNLDICIDRCFCKDCKTQLIWYRGDGWYRFGIKIRDEYINNKIEMSNWHIGYHGTRIKSC